MHTMKHAAISILTMLVIVLLGYTWYQGTYDKVLVNVGLNAHPCIQLYFGQTLCGDAAKDFCLTYYDPTYNGAACNEILGS